MLRGSWLNQFSAWKQTSNLVLTSKESAYLDESERHETLEREEEQVRQAREAAMEQQALRQISIGLAAQALEESAGRNPERAIPLALQALERYPYTPQAHSALSQVVIGQRIQGRISPEGAVNAMQLSADGRRMLLATRKGRILVWNLERATAEYELVDGEPFAGQWSPDERFIFSESKTRHEFYLWDGQKGEIMYARTLDARLYSTSHHYYPWSPDSQAFVTGHRDGTARIWDARDGTLIHELPGHPNDCTAYWSSSGSEIITIGHEDQRAIIWDSSTGAKRYELAFERPIHFGCWSPDGRQFVLRQHGGCRLYDLENDTEILFLETEMTSNWDAKWSPDGRWLLVTGDVTGVAWLWDLETGSLKATQEGMMQGYGVSWSPSSRYVAIGILEGVRIWDIHSELPADHITVSGDIDFLCWSPDEATVYASDDDIGEVMILRAHTADHHISGPAGGGGGSVSWIGSKQIARAYGDGEVKIFDSQTLDMIHSLDSGNRYGSVYGELDGRRIITTNWDGRIRLWRARDGELLLDIDDHTWAMICALSPDGKKLAVYAGDRPSEQHGVIVWDVASGRELWRMFDERSFIGSVSWSPEGDQLAVTFGGAGSAYALDAETGEILWTIVEEFPEASSISGIEWSNDGQRLAYSQEGIIHIVDVASQDVVARGQEGQTVSWTYTWLKGDRYLLSTSGPDGKLRLIEAHTCETVLTNDIGGWATADLSPDETQLLVSTNDGSTRLYPFWKTLEELIAYAREQRMQRELTPEERELFGLED